MDMSPSSTLTSTNSRTGTVTNTHRKEAKKQSSTKEKEI